MEWWKLKIVCVRKRNESYWWQVVDMNRETDRWDERKKKGIDGNCTMDNTGFKGYSDWTMYTKLNAYSLQLTDNHIGAEGAIQISESLKTNTTLTSLDLHGDDKI